MEYLVRKVNYEDLEKAFLLIWDTFLEFVAPDYSKEAVETFKINFIENEDFKECFKNGKQIMYGAYFEEKLVGVISISEKNHVSCVFIGKNYHRNGIATMLFNQLISELKKRQVKRITLNSSPYAIHFYHAIGFIDLGEQQEFQGILFTPMELIL